MGPRWSYTASEVRRGLRRNVLMTAATLLTVLVSLTLLGVGLLIQRQVDMTSRLFYSSVEVSIFLQDDLPQDQKESFRRDLEANPEVEGVLYETKQQAWENFQEIYRDDESLINSATVQDMPESFRVSLNDPEQYDVVASQYQSYPGVDEVRNQREVLDRLFRLLGVLTLGVAVIAALQLAGGAALIANTIRLSAFARREQIGIMKLVGATNWYIRLPFILEGIIAGLVGSVLAVGLLAAAELLLFDRIRSAISFTPVVNIGDVLAIAPLLVVVGAGVAALASFFSLRRFLDV